MVCFLSLSATAQPFTFDGHALDGGGGTSSGGQYAVSGTIGQPDAGAMAGGNYELQGGFWSAYVAIQTTGAPTLTVKRLGNNVEFSWPVEGSSGFVLEQTGSLNPTINWLSAGAIPSAADGRWVVTLPVETGQHFFRLRLPAN